MFMIISTDTKIVFFLQNIGQTPSLREILINYEAHFAEKKKLEKNVRHLYLNSAGQGL